MTIRVGRLDTPARLRAELSRLYRQARQTAGASVTPADALRLSSVLAAIRTQLDIEQLTERLTELEKRK